MKKGDTWAASATDGSCGNRTRLSRLRQDRRNQMSPFTCWNQGVETSSEQNHTASTKAKGKTRGRTG